MGELPGVTRADCIDKFIEFYPKFTSSDGHDLLTLSGFLNEYAGGIGKIHPYLAWTVSVAMLIVSIIALRAQG